MKKIHLTVIVVLLNLVAVYFWLIYTPKQNIYSEEVIQNVASDLDEKLDKLFLDIYKEVDLIQNDHRSKSMSLKGCNDYFLEVLSKHKYIRSLLFFKNNKKFIISREKASTISACDSTEVVDVVKWTRFEDKKKVSEWEEVFDKKNYNSKWVDDLKLNLNKFQWVYHYLPMENKGALLLGKSWKDDDNIYSLAIRFSREEVRKSFKSVEQFKRFSVLFKTKRGITFNLASNVAFEEDSVLYNNDFTNALEEGLKKFQINKNRIFSYVYNNESYWAAVKNVNSILSINQIVISIPDVAIQQNAKKTDTFGLLYYLIELLFSIVVLVIIYRKSISVPKFRIGRNRNISIDTILKDNENRHLEFKSSLRWDYRQEKVNPDLELVILKTIAAFGNSDGGILLIGVDDDKNILGIENDLNTLKKKDADFYEIYMRNLFHKYFGVKYTTENIRMDFIKDSEKEVCLIEVFKADEPLYLKTKDKSGQITEKFYVRSGNSSQQINSLKDINDYIFDRFRKE